MGCSNYTTSSCGNFYSNTSAIVYKVPTKSCCEKFVRNKKSCDSPYDSYSNKTCSSSCSPNYSSCTSCNNSQTNSCYMPEPYNCNSMPKPCNCMQKSCNCNSMQNTCNCNSMQNSCNCNSMHKPCVIPQINCNELLANHLNLINQAIEIYGEGNTLLNGQAEALVSQLISLINEIIALTCQGNNTIDKSKCLLNETNCAIPCCNSLLHNATEKYDLEIGYLNSVLESLEKASKGLHGAICAEQQGSMYLSQYVNCLNSNSQHEDNSNNYQYNNCGNYSNLGNCGNCGNYNNCCH